MNFYVTPADVTQLHLRISEIEPMRILHDRSSTARPREVRSLNLVEETQPLLFYFLVRERDLALVATEHVPAQGYWTVDYLRSPVVQFNSCYFDGKILRRGRVYHVDGFYGADDTWVDKSESFRSWAKAVLRTTKKVLQKHGSEYIGEDALAWLERENGKLVT
ncbi:hypothetical protein [Chondromyces crocatus]|uniref:hypothetical protein n=1 Tax=Chondromyces crocatus TaxID=52 RepID=UPI0012E19BEC|nr:hypothetical protein [Chondromyces crocatus]